MSKSKLDQLIEAKLKSREAESRYHKRGRLLEVKESLGKMLRANLSIKEQIEVLEEAGITLSDKSYREFLAREFGGEYDDFLKRNGWIRKKRQRENDA